MAERYGYWIVEQGAGGGDGPTSAGVLRRALLVGLALIAAGILGPQPEGRESAGQGPSWRQPACVERDRLARHGATGGPSYRAAARACRRARAVNTFNTHEGP